jgi:hypothetical protein
MQIYGNILKDSTQQTTNCFQGSPSDSLLDTIDICALYTTIYTKSNFRKTYWHFNFNNNLFLALQKPSVYFLEQLTEIKTTVDFDSLILRKLPPQNVSNQVQTDNNIIQYPFAWSEQDFEEYFSV